MNFAFHSKYYSDWRTNTLRSYSAMNLLVDSRDHAVFGLEGPPIRFPFISKKDKAAMQSRNPQQGDQGFISFAFS
jgi:hypothetical protein